MRLSGLATGMDTDNMVKEMMKPYRIKVDRVKQDKMTMGYQQDIYRDVLKQSQDFYNKYFSVTSKDSLMSSSNWQTVGFSSSNESVVTAKGSAGADASNYKVNVKSLAAEASITAKGTDVFDASGKLLTDTINIKVNGGAEISVDLTGATNKDDVVSKINKSFKDNKIDATAEYSQFSEGFVLKTNGMGKDKSIGFSLGSGTPIPTKGTEFFDGSGNLLTDTINIQVSGGSKISVDLTGATNKDDVISKINQGLKDNGIDATAEYNELSKELTFKTNGANKDIAFSLGAGTPISTAAAGFSNGTDAEVELKNARGETHTYTGSTNAVTLDGINFEFHGVSTGTEHTSLTGKNDVSKTKDNIVNLVNDYNKLIENINKQLLTKHDKTYKPLTDEQRKDMSEDEQKLWDKKAKEGLLRSDNNLTRISNGLKNIMRTAFDGVNLQSIGINPVNNYGEQNGMFTIDEYKLTEALEKRPDEVKDLFLRQPVDNDDPSTGGILYKMKDTLFNETVSVSAPLMKKAGMEGSVTSFNNDLTTTMEKKQKIIAEMERDLATRENNYYLQFSRLETQMNKLNSQNAYLMSQLGGGK